MNILVLTYEINRLIIFVEVKHGNLTNCLKYNIKGDLTYGSIKS